MFKASSANTQKVSVRFSEFSLKPSFLRDFEVKIDSGLFL